MSDAPVTTGEQKWLYQFLKPGFHEMLRVREILAAMPIYAPLRERQFLAKDSMTLEGPLEDVVAKLADALADDYAGNAMERETAPWDFDYVVTDNGASKRAIELYTRLFNPRDATMGSSLYGRTIRRISEKTYRLWADVS